MGDVRRAVAQAMRYAGCLNRRSLGVSDVFPQRRRAAGTLEVAGGGGLYYFHGLWPAEVSAATSNFRELLTLLLGQRLAQRLFGGDGRKLRVLAYTDNSTTAATANRGSTASAELWPLARLLALDQVYHDVDCQACWCPGRALIKQGSDPLSRGAYAAQDHPRPTPRCTPATSSRT